MNKPILERGVGIDEQNLNILERIHASYDQLTAAERKEEQRLVRQAIDSLGNPDREIFLRHYYYAQTVSRISREMHLNPSTVKTKLSRGRQRLKTLLMRWEVL